MYIMDETDLYFGVIPLISSIKIWFRQTSTVCISQILNIITTIKKVLKLSNETLENTSHVKIFCILYFVFCILY